MASFPNYKPSARVFTAGDYPQSQFTTLGGYDVRVLHGNRPVGDRLTLTFGNVADATGQAIMDHFRNQQGSYQRFILPNGVWAGGSNLTAAGQYWVYVEPPAIDWVRPGICTVSCSLRSVS